MPRYKLNLFRSLILILSLSLFYLFWDYGTPNKESNSISTSGVISIKDIALGTYIEVEWRNRPVIIFRPDAAIELELKELNKFVNSPTFPFKEARFFIYERISTNRGCGAVYKTAKEANNMEDVKWFGGWIDPCHYGAWDKAGRSYMRQPSHDAAAQLPNLSIPKWRYLSKDVIELL
jgi:Rieske Fe-S protein